MTIKLKLFSLLMCLYLAFVPFQTRALEPASTVTGGVGTSISSIAYAISGWGGSALSSISSGLSSAGSFLASAGSSLWSGVSLFGESAWNAVGGFASDFGSVISGWTSSASSWTGTVGDSLLNWYSGSNLSSGVSSMVNAVSDWSSSSGLTSFIQNPSLSGLGTTLSNWGTGALDSMGSVGSVISDFMSNPLQSLSSAGSSLANWGSAAWSDIGGFANELGLGNFASSVSSWTGSLGDTLSNWASSAWTGVSDFAGNLSLGSLGDTLSNWAGGAWSGVSDFVGNISLGSIGDTISGLGSSVWTGLSDGASWLTGSIGSALDGMSLSGMGDGIMSSLSGVFGGVENIGSSVVSWAGDAWTSLSGYGSDLMGSLGGSLSGLGDTLGSWSATALNGIGDAWNSVSSWGAGVYDSFMGSDIGGMLGGALDSFTSGVGTLMDSAGDLLGSAMDAVGDVASSIGESVGDLFSEGMDLLGLDEGFTITPMFGSGAGIPVVESARIAQLVQDLMQKMEKVTQYADEITSTTEQISSLGDLGASSVTDMLAGATNIGTLGNVVDFSGSSGLLAGAMSAASSAVSNVNNLEGQLSKAMENVNTTASDLTKMQGDLVKAKTEAVQKLATAQQAQQQVAGMLGKSQDSESSAQSYVKQTFFFEMEEVVNTTSEQSKTEVSEANRVDQARAQYLNEVTSTGLANAYEYLSTGIKEAEEQEQDILNRLAQAQTFDEKKAVEALAVKYGVANQIKRAALELRLLENEVVQQLMMQEKYLIRVPTKAEIEANTLRDTEMTEVVEEAEEES